MSETYDVIIAGGGPVGLFLACELGSAGVSVLVLEAEADTLSPWKARPLGMRGLSTLSVESFYRRGLMTKIFDPNEERPQELVKTEGFQFGGHFAGLPLNVNKLDLSRWKYRLQSPALLPGRTYLARVIAALSERAETFGVKILYGKPVTNVEPSKDSVSVKAGDEIFTGKWLVGADGGRSKVRKAAGFEFVGTGPEFTGYSVLCELDDPERFEHGFHRTKEGMFIVAEPRHVFVLDFDGGAFDRSQPVTREHFEQLLRRVTGTDIGVKAIHLASTFTDRAMQVTNYRQGRVLLAGDAAHIHSPLGAQGLNTGLGDAMNLGWKLAATINGTAPAGLLDSYHAERHPIAQWVLEWTRAQVATLKPTLTGQASANVIKDLIKTVDGTNYFIDKMWGLSQRYDLGDEHELAGSSAPDFEFLDGKRLADKMCSGRALFIDFEQNAQLKKIAHNWEGFVDYISIDAKHRVGLKALLVRPDGIVAWVAENHLDTGAALSALHKWFGKGQGLI